MSGAFGALTNIIRVVALGTGGMARWADIIICDFVMSTHTYT